MAQFPTAFPQIPASSITSYSYTDIIEGTGIVSYYGARLETTAGVTWELTTKGIASSGFGAAPQISGIVAGTTYEFNAPDYTTPKDLMGNMYVAGTMISNAGNSIYIKVTAQKVSGATVTDISSEITSNTSSNGVSQNVYMAVPLTMTHFNTGDNLRIKVIVVGVNTAQYMIADPAETTIDPLRFEVPQRLNI